MSKVNVLGVGIDDIDKASLERAIVSCVEKGRKEIFAYANVHAVNIARRNSAFKQILNSATVVYCDGEGIRLGAKVLGMSLRTRTALTHWIWDLGALFQDNGFSVYLLGGRSESVCLAANRLCEQYARLRLVGYHHGYFDRYGPENEEVIRLINCANPNILFVGFGMPDQEVWIEQNIEQLKVNAIMPCGGMIDYLSGDVKTAPKWMSGSGMEWVHRLIQDPARLWRRYFLGNPMFLFRIFLHRLTGRG